MGVVKMTKTKELNMATGTGKKARKQSKRLKGELKGKKPKKAKFGKWKPHPKV
jgi:hypothetical protein